MSDHPLLVNGAPIRYDLVPVPYMADGMKLYLENGIAPGSFMHAVLEGDLFSACARADGINRHNIWKWAEWLHNYAPSGSFGSPERVAKWIAGRQQTGFKSDLGQPEPSHP